MAADLAFPRCCPEFRNESSEISHTVCGGEPLWCQVVAALATSVPWCQDADHGEKERGLCCAGGRQRACVSSPTGLGAVAPGLKFTQPR